MEREDKVAKTHSGVLSRFGLLAKSDPALGSWFSAFLARGYELKDIADYGYDLTVDGAAADAAIEDADRFLTAIEAGLADTPWPSPAASHGARG
jgi:uncharacterized protein (UPF0332 family)